MKSSWGVSPKNLALELRSYLQNPETTGGGYRPAIGKNRVRCEIGGYHIEYKFISDDECNVRINNGSSIEDKFKVPYIHEKEIDWDTFFLMTCGLVKKLTDSE